MVVRLESQILEEANLARVKSDYEGAVLQEEADRELFESGLVSEINYKKSRLAADQLTKRFEIEQQRFQKTAESIDAQLAVKRTQVDQQQALYQLRSDQLDSLRVKAGIAGVLQQVPVEEGQRVIPGTNMARVAQPEKLKAEVRINETQAKDVQVGQVAEIDTRNGVIAGKVTRIDPAVQQGTVTVDVKLEGELPRGAPTCRSTASSSSSGWWTCSTSTVLPTARRTAPSGLFKLAEDGKMAQLVQVKLGRTSVNQVEILGGLAQGDEVILSDSSQWDDVDRIRLR